MEAKSMKRKLRLVVAATFALAAQMSQANSADLRLIGSGASFPFPIYSAWFKDFSKKTDGVKVDYQAKGSGAGIQEQAIDFVLSITGGHPYATQELCYFLWQRASSGKSATAEDARAALADVLRSEDSHFTALWGRATSHQRVLLQALAREPGHPLASDYRRRYGLPSAASVQSGLWAISHT